jgi:hypothetical protein
MWRFLIRRMSWFSGDVGPSWCVDARVLAGLKHSVVVSVNPLFERALVRSACGARGRGIWIVIVNPHLIMRAASPNRFGVA